MRNKSLAIYLAGWMLCLLLPVMVSAGAVEDIRWNKANTFYVQKQYDSAYNYYSQLLQQYPGNAGLQYNMGNTCYRLNKVGAAILHYEKANHLEPGNKEVQDNLLLAKARVQNPLPEVAPIFFLRWWNGFLHLFSSDTWAVLTLLIFAGVLVLIYYARVRKEQFAHSGRWLSLSIVALMICGCMLYFTYYAHTDSGKAVVLEANAGFTDAPRAGSKIVGLLPEGTVVEVYGEDGNFVNIKLPNGREGWIAAAALGEV